MAQETQEEQVDPTPVQRRPGTTGRVLGAMAVLLAVAVGLVLWQVGTQRVEVRRGAEAAAVARAVEAAKDTARSEAGKTAYLETVARTKGKKMAAWTASGAGDSSYNGNFIESGTYNGKPAYVNASGRWLWYCAVYPPSHEWALSAAKASETVAYLNDAETLPGTWLVGTGTAPAPTLAAAPSIIIGSDAADAAKWDVAANHRYSLYGDASGGYKDVDADTTGPSPLVPIATENLTAASYYYIRFKCEGHLIRQTANFLGNAPPTNVGALPWGSSADWITWLGAAGAKTLTVELVDVSTGLVVADDTAAYTMFIPALTVSSPTAASTQPDRFNAVVAYSEWWYPTGTGYYQARFYAVLDGDEYYLSAGALPDTGNLTQPIDLIQAGYDAGPPISFPWPDGPPAGVITLRVRHWLVDPGEAGPLIDVDVGLTHAETYTVEITTPSAGTAFPFPQNLSVGVFLAQGWIGLSPTGSTGSWYVSVRDATGTWQERAIGAVPELGWYTGGGVYELGVRNRTSGLFPLYEGDTAIKVDWGYWTAPGGDWISLDTDQIAITVAAGPPTPPPTPPPPPPAPPEGYQQLSILLPAAGATVGDDFTAYLYYAGFTATASATLLIRALQGAVAYELYNETVTIGADGYLVYTLDASGLSDAAFTLLAQLTGIDSELASDSRDLIEGTAGTTPPTVEITAPLNGATVSGDVTVDVTATSANGIYAVSFQVDGVTVETIGAPNNGGDWQFTWDSAAFANGSHVLTAIAWDADLNSATDSITVNLANTQADQTLLWFTKQLGYSGGSPLGSGGESEDFLDRDFNHAIITPYLPDPATLPTDPRLVFNLAFGYNVPGVSKLWADATVVTPFQSFKVMPKGRSIRYFMCATPQESLANWQITAADVPRMVAASNGDPLILATGPHALYRFAVDTNALSQVADLSSLASAPVDLATVGNMAFVASGARVYAIDEATGNISWELILPFPEEASAVTCLASDGENLYVAADLTAGGSRLYQWSYGSGSPVATEASPVHAYSFTALAYLGGVLYVGNDNGDILTCASGVLTLAYATGEASVLKFALVGSVVYAGTGTGGKLYRYLTGWALAQDFGWTNLRGLSSFRGYAYAGGSGTGGQYAWYESAPGVWAQTVNFPAATALNDLLLVTDSAGHDQLFALAVGDGTYSYLYRVEVAPASEYVCGVTRPDFRGKILDLA